MVNRRFIRHNVRNTLSLNTINKTPKGKTRFRVTAVILVLVTICVLIDLSIRPILNRAVSYQSKLITSKLISECTYGVIEQMNLDYDDLVKVTALDSGEISSIKSNVSAINNVKSTIIKEIIQKLNDNSSYRYSIPLGTVLGNDYLIDRGPKIGYSISPMGFAEGNVVSKFDTAGINQTRHQIILEIKVDITTLIPLHNANTVITTNYILAETVIAGRVPQFYTLL